MRMKTTEPVLDLSTLVGSPLLDSAGERLGRVEDVIVRLDSGDELPPVTGLKARIGGREAFVPADRIARLEPGAARTSTTKLNLAQFERRPGEVMLRGDLLGRSVIDVTTARLVKVRDVELVEPAQIADLVEAASHDEGEEILAAVGQDKELEADVFEELDDEHQVEFLRERSDEEAAAVLARMASDDAADLLLEIEQDRRIPVLNLLPAAKQLKIKRLLGYNPSTAGGLMNPDFPSLPAAATVADGQEYVRRSELAPSQLLVLWVVDDQGSLIGGVFSSELLIGQERAPVTSLIETAVPTVAPETELPEVARLMSDFNLLELLLPEEWRRRAGEARG